VKIEISQKENLIYRLLFALAIIVVAAALRIAPHPWNFTPIGAMALFSGALVGDRRLAFAFPLLTLFFGDLFLGFYKSGLMLVVYASFLLSVLIGRWVENHRSLARISGATLLGSIQFFLITNFGVWALGSSYPHSLPGLTACYARGVPFFWNTLAGDTFYVTVFFGGFALAEHFVPVLREPARASIQ